MIRKVGMSAHLLAALFVVVANCMTHAQQLFDPIQLVKQMTLRQQIAQLMMVAVISNEEKNQKTMDAWDQWASCRLDHAYIDDLIMTEDIGGLIFFGAESTAQDQLDTINHFENMSKIPLWFGLDTETCLANRLNEESVIRFPCAMALGACNDPLLTYQIGNELGRELGHCKIQVAFSPVADVNYNPLNPIIDTRSFGSDRDLVAVQSIAFMQGLQDAGVIACGKHFPGHGDTVTDSHEELPTIAHNQERLFEIELYPFKKLIDAGVDAMMLAHLHVPALDPEPGKPSSLSYAIVTEMLKNQLGFDGLIFTDALAMKGATDYAAPGKLEFLALLAGADVLLCPLRPKDAIDYIENAVLEGIISANFIEQKALKVMREKARTLTNTRLYQNDGRSLESILFDPYADNLCKHAFAQSITLTKEELPTTISFDKTLLLTVSDSKKQTTLEKELTDKISRWRIPTALNEIQQATALGICSKFDHVIISLHNIHSRSGKEYGIDAKIITLLQELKLKKNGPHVTVLLFGTPYAATLLNDADSIICCYSNAKTAQVVTADILEGLAYPRGLLPVELA